MLLLSFSAVSCFDDKYDLKKDIDMTVTVGGEKMVIPLGDTEEMTLDKLIDTTETFKLEDGVYSFKKNDDIDDVNIDVEAVNISIDNPTIDPIVVDFGESTDIDPFEVDLADPTFAVDIADIKVDDSKLPQVDLQINQNFMVPSPGLKVTQFEIPIDAVTQNISVNLNASTFTDIKEVREVCFGDEKGKQEVEFSINTAEIKNLFEKGMKQNLKELKVLFAEGFVLSLKDDYAGTLSVSENVLLMKNVDLTNVEQLSRTFYVDKFVHSFDKEHLTFEDELSLSVTYLVDGKFKSTPNAKGVFSAHLFEVGGFKFDKAAVVTKDVSVAVEGGNFDFKTTVKGLENLDRIEEITFKKDSKFTLQLNALNLPFDFHETSLFVVDIPEIFEVELGSAIPGVSYANNRLSMSASYMKNPSQPILLDLKSIDFKKEDKGFVENGILTVNETLTYHAESTLDGQEQENQLVVKGGNLIYTDELLDMHRDIVLSTDCHTGNSKLLEVDNALVVANAVSSDIDTSTDFEVKQEDMPEEVKSLKQVYLENDGRAKLLLEVDFRELPKDIKKGISLSPLTVNLPEFIMVDRDKFNTDPEKSYIDEKNVMTIKETFVPSESNQYTYCKEVEVVGLDFTKISEYEKEGLTIGEDYVLTLPKKYTEVLVTGKVTTAPGEVVNSKNFEDFSIYPRVQVDDMVIGKVIGKVDPKIDPVEELVDLNLDDDLDFLKDDNSELYIKNPTINVMLKNTVGVPVNLDLKISGHKQGCSEPIEGSEVYASTATYPDFKLYPAIGCDTMTTNILISKEEVKMEQQNDDTHKYVNVVIPDLSELLVHLPDEVRFTLDAKADQSVDHEIDITPNFSEGGKDKARFLIKGNYDVTVPLVFDSLNINYNDSIDNLNEDLWDFLDIALYAELDVKADLTNQLPADLHLNATAVDRNGKELKSIQVDVFVDDVKDGLIPGVTAEGTQVVVPIRIELRAVDADELKKLDKLLFNVHAVISQTKNGVPLKAKQSVQFKNVKAYVKKVDLDLN